MPVGHQGWAGSLALALVLGAGAATAQSLSGQRPAASEPGDHAVVFELGAAGDWSHGEGTHPGGTFAFEITPIEHWLEVEVGATALRASDGVETSGDILFKKPWPFSRAFEFMVGAGPEIVHATGSDGATFWGVEGVLDFMFWPRPNIGWYVEPGGEMTRRVGTTRYGVEIAAGLLIGR